VARQVDTAAPLVPTSTSLDDVAAAARGCTACPLHRDATQTVFGEGVAAARVVLVGEQPGDKEDLAGAPFVGPAGRLLDDALVAAGVDRQLAYVTNAVKHFKWTRKGNGKVRLHQKPSAGEVAACRPWLEAELARIRPEVVVCLGATAAQSVVGKHIRVTQDRGAWHSSDLAPRVLVTIHPSAVLRARTPAERDEAFAGLVADLRLVPPALDQAAGH
jgi:DNA polymerase